MLVESIKALKSKVESLESDLKKKEDSYTLLIERIELLENKGTK